MSYLTFYMPDDLTHMTYHRLCQDVSCLISHIILTHCIVHITRYMLLIPCYGTVKYPLHITLYVSHSTCYLSHVTNLRMRTADQACVTPVVSQI